MAKAVWGFCFLWVMGGNGDLGQTKPQPFRVSS